MKSAIEYRKYESPDGLTIQLPELIFESIQRQVAKYYPRECGGIFVGRVVGSAAVIQQIMMPKTFYSTPIFFRRMASLVNRWLSRVFKQSEGETIYLGEWHSHPNGIPIPSITDFTTMKKIAEYEGVRIKTPILMIVGYDGNTYAETFYLFNYNKLVHYHKINQ